MIFAHRASQPGDLLAIQRLGLIVLLPVLENLGDAAQRQKCGRMIRAMNALQPLVGAPN